MLQRVKEVQESDLRMVGALARNIQRVIAVTQADIDAAAAQGRAWLVKPVVKVSDPLDNLRGGTQLVIKQNSILPGQNVMRVIYQGGQAVVVGPGTSPLSLPDATDNDILSLIAFGGTEQRNIPQPYTQVNYVTNTAQTAVDTGIMIDFAKNYEFEVECRAVSGSWYVLQSRASASGNVTGIHGETSGSNIKLVVGNVTVCTSAITRTVGNKLYVKATLNAGTATLYVKDETANTEDTQTGSYGTTQPNPTASVYLLGNAGGQYVDVNSDIYMARIKENNTVVMDYVPARQVATAGFYDTVSGTFKTALTPANLSAGGEAVPTPDYPMDIICNNGVLKARHQSGLPLGYTLLDYIESTGTQYLDLGVKGNGDNKVDVTFRYHTVTSASGSGRVFGSRTNSSSNAFAIGSSAGVVSATGNKVFWCYDAQSFFVIDNPIFPVGDWQTVVFSATEHTLNGVSYGDDYNVVVFETPQNLKLFGFDNGGTMGYGQVDVARCKLWDNGVLIRDLVPCKNASNVVGMYDLANDQFYTNDGTGDFVAGDPVSDPVEVYTTGPIETIAIKDDQSATVSTATCEDLLSVGTYTDEQEVISGGVTRKVGVKVLDGTESWSSLSTNRAYTVVDTKAPGVVMLCNKYPNTNDSLSPSYAVYGRDNNKTIVFKDIDRTTNLETWRQYLANQYAAGTPVIVVYPLATETTESVAGQPMQTAAGDNTAEITQASLTGLELEAEYIEA